MSKLGMGSRRGRGSKSTRSPASNPRLAVLGAKKRRASTAENRLQDCDRESDEDEDDDERVYYSYDKMKRRKGVEDDCQDDKGDESDKGENESGGDESDGGQDVTSRPKASEVDPNRPGSDPDFRLYRKVDEDTESGQKSIRRIKSAEDEDFEEDVDERQLKKATEDASRTQDSLSIGPARSISINGSNIARGPIDPSENVHISPRKEAANGRDEMGKKRPKVKAKRDESGIIQNPGQAKLPPSLVTQSQQYPFLFSPGTNTLKPFSYGDNIPFMKQTSLPPLSDSTPLGSNQEADMVGTITRNAIWRPKTLSGRGLGPRKSKYINLSNNPFSATFWYSRFAVTQVEEKPLPQAEWSGSIRIFSDSANPEEEILIPDLRMDLSSHNPFKLSHLPNVITAHKVKVDSLPNEIRESFADNGTIQPVDVDLCIQAASKETGETDSQMDDSADDKEIQERPASGPAEGVFCVHLPPCHQLFLFSKSMVGTKSDAVFFVKTVIKDNTVKRSNILRNSLEQNASPSEVTSEKGKEVLGRKTEFAPTKLDTQIAPPLCPLPVLFPLQLKYGLKEDESIPLRQLRFGFLGFQEKDKEEVDHIMNSMCKGGAIYVKNLEPGSIDMIVMRCDSVRHLVQLTQDDIAALLRQRSILFVSGLGFLTRCLREKTLLDPLSIGRGVCLFPYNGRVLTDADTLVSKDGICRELFTTLSAYSFKTAQRAAQRAARETEFAIERVESNGPGDKEGVFRVSGEKWILKISRDCINKLREWSQLNESTLEVEEHIESIGTISRQELKKRAGSVLETLQTYSRLVSEIDDTELSRSNDQTTPQLVRTAYKIACQQVIDVRHVVVFHANAEMESAVKGLRLLEFCSDVEQISLLLSNLDAQLGGDGRIEDHQNSKFPSNILKQDDEGRARKLVKFSQQAHVRDIPSLKPQKTVFRQQERWVTLPRPGEEDVFKTSKEIYNECGNKLSANLKERGSKRFALDREGWGTVSAAENQADAPNAESHKFNNPEVVEPMGERESILNERYVSPEMNYRLLRDFSNLEEKKLHDNASTTPIDNHQLQRDSAFLPSHQLDAPPQVTTNSPDKDMPDENPTDAAISDSSTGIYSSMDNTSASEAVSNEADDSHGADSVDDWLLKPLGKS